MGAIATKKTKASVSSGLNADQKKFCLEYIKDFNATRAYKAAYPKSSDATADTNGTRLLGTARVQAFIDAVIEERNQALKIDANRVVFELAQIAFSDLDDFASWDDQGLKFKSSDTIKHEKRRVVKRVKFLQKGDGSSTLEIERDDRMKALELLGRHVGMWRDSPEQKSDNLTALVGALKSARAKRGE